MAPFRADQRTRCLKAQLAGNGVARAAADGVGFGEAQRIRTVHLARFTLDHPEQQIEGLVLPPSQAA